jgi:hypothetical protein
MTRRAAVSKTDISRAIKGAVKAVQDGERAVIEIDPRKGVVRIVVERPLASGKELDAL